MAKAKVNADNITEFCNEVYITTGKDPTYEEVKNALGGSYSTIKPYLQSWLEEPRPPRFQLPEAIGTKASHLAQVIWSFALADARQLMEEKGRKAADAIVRTQKELDVAIQEISKLEAERDRLSASVESLIADRAELKVRLEGMDSLAAQFRTSEAAERAMRDARDEARDEVNLLRGQVQAMERQVTYLMSTHVPHTKGRRTRNGQRPKAETTN